MREKSPRFAEPLKRKVQWTLRAAKTLARLDRANDFPIWRAEQLKAEALLLRCEDVRALRPRERHDLPCSVIVSNLGIFGTNALQGYIQTQAS